MLLQHLRDFSLVLQVIRQWHLPEAGQNHAPPHHIIAELSIIGVLNPFLKHLLLAPVKGKAPLQLQMNHCSDVL